jgi:hypothetical protein
VAPFVKNEKMNDVNTHVHNWLQILCLSPPQKKIKTHSSTIANMPGCIKQINWIDSHEICLSSGILETRQHNVSQTRSVSVLRCVGGGGGGDTYSVVSLRESPVIEDSSF